MKIYSIAAIILVACLIGLTSPSLAAAGGAPAGCAGATEISVKADTQATLQPNGIPNDPTKYTYAWSLYDKDGVQVTTATTYQFTFTPATGKFPYYVKLGITDNTITGGCVGLICIQVNALPGIVCPTVADLCRGTLTNYNTYTVTSTTGSFPAGTTYAWTMKNSAGADVSSFLQNANTATVKIDWRVVTIPADTYTLHLVVTMSGKTFTCDKTITLVDTPTFTISEVTSP
jgi:hypothetical protein